MVLKIGTLNCRGGNSKISQICKLFTEQKLDILLLQETHVLRDQSIKQLEKETHCKVYNSEGTNKGRGVTTLLRESKHLTNSSLKSKDRDGNLLVINAEIDGKQIELINIYGPMRSIQRRDLIQKILDQLQGKTNCIIGGDFNNFEDFNLDCIGGSLKNFNRKSLERQQLYDLKRIFDYDDTFRELNPHKHVFTYTSPSNYRSRLDRIYIHASKRANIHSVYTSSAYFSDHDLYAINLESETETERIKWGNGLWKYNRLLLRKKVNLEILTKEWMKWRSEKCNYNNVIDWWEVGKRTVLKETCIKIGRQERKNENDEENKMIDELKKVTNSNTAASAKKITAIKKKLNDIEVRKMDGAKARTKLQWQSEGEKYSKFFFDLETKNGKGRNIRKLIDDNGNVLTKKDDVMNHLQLHFQNVYSESKIEKQSTLSLLDSVTKKLSDFERQNQSGFFTTAELEKVKKRMKKGKSPGNDGLSFDFYDQTWEILKDDLLEVMNEIHSTNKMGLSMTQGIITLIYKNKGDRNNVKFYRPITLLNTDYKFLTGMIANRIYPYLPSLIGIDQACAVDGRRMEDQLICIQDIYDYITQFKKKALIMSLDLEAAFDKINHIYLHALLEKLNFSYKIRDILRTIYENMYSAVIVNGAKTQFFKLGRSIRQGDGISMCLFVLAIEPLANIIRSDTRLHAVIIPNQQPKIISQYCDDTNILTTDVNDVKIIETHTDTFEKGAGAKLNHGKSEISTIGKWTSVELDQLPQHMMRDNLKILGVWFGPEDKRLNRENILKKIDEVVKFWNTIPLSFEGKRLIVNTKFLPVLYHIIRIKGLDKETAKQVQTRITKFFWFPKTMRMIRYGTLQNTIENGGQCMPNLDIIDSAILAERIGKFLNRKQPWSGQFIYRLGFRLRELGQDLASPKYVHSFKSTEICDKIKNTYAKLKNKVVDWKNETFSSLKEKLRRENDYCKILNRNYSHTWTTIHNSTKNRRRNDISYLIAHDSLPIADTLVRRGVKTNRECRLCGEEDETREHLFNRCKNIRTLKLRLNKSVGRTLSEEAIIFHEGRIKMKKKDHENITIMKQTIWQVRAMLYYGEIKPSEIENTLLAKFGCNMVT